MKKLIVTLVMSLFALPILCLGQNTYESTGKLIDELRKTKTVNWATGDMISSIIEGIVQDPSYPEGNKMRLIGNSTYKTVNSWRAVATNNASGDILMLMYYGRQSVPVFITDKKLMGIVGKEGGGLKNKVTKIWNNSKITDDQFNALQYYPPATASRLVCIISKPWYITIQEDYRHYHASWASESLQRCVYEINLAEFTKHSTIAKLLDTEGYLDVPTGTFAYFTWSGIPDVYIDLGRYTWNESDIPVLIGLLQNKWYGDAARRQLNRMGISA